MYTFVSFAMAVIFTTESCNKAQVDALKPKPKPDSTSTAITAPVTGREIVLVPDKDGRLVVDGSIYKGGDILALKGVFSAVVFNNLKGAAGSPIIVKNAAGTVTKVGNPAWSGGSWATALSFVNCHYVKAGGEKSKSDFIISGSTQAGKEAYFNLTLSRHTDNFEVSNVTIQNGGTGIWAKTDPVNGDASTQYPNSYMENLSIHDVAISGTNNEAFYIGHTALYWNLTANTPYYGAPSGFVAGQQYVQPIKWRNVKIYNNQVSNGGADGIQTAAIDKLEIYGNTVTSWGGQHNSGHNGGILIGGRVTSSNVHDNYVHDGWGELIQFYGSGENGVAHIIHNNLLRDNQGDGVSLRGTNNAVVQITNNTIARVGGVSLRINGYQGMTTPQIVNANAFIQPRVNGGSIVPNAYIYTENGGAYKEGTGALANTKFPTVTAAGIDLNNYYQPVSGSALASSGFRVN
ncbi:right-handed parallel beta-helix repeat-containing protein [Chitinophaga sp. 2R12]|uniref:Right-handed parallel beta-helix repeat-containing protein n=2 Tax=Chitinophagaceae TaxID=563835 RepID=A0ABS5J9R9_9BACT|nr:right-handed parallel beta-helix repeat-containing protein [Chitinophaga hostae]